MARRDPVAGERQVAARQIHRSLSAWGQVQRKEAEADADDPHAHAEGKDASAEADVGVEDQAATAKEQAPEVGTKVFLARGKGGDDDLSKKKELQETLDKCGRCIKILEQFDRLAQKMNITLPPARLAALTTKRDGGTITAEDLPAGLRGKYDLDMKLTLTQIRALQTETDAALKALKK